MLQEYIAAIRNADIKRQTVIGKITSMSPEERNRDLELLEKENIGKEFWPLYNSERWVWDHREGGVVRNRELIEGVGEGDKFSLVK